MVGSEAGYHVLRPGLLDVYLDDSYLVLTSKH